jgi:hypothetical protein
LLKQGGLRPRRLALPMLVTISSGRVLTAPACEPLPVGSNGLNIGFLAARATPPALQLLGYVADSWAAEVQS